MIACFYKEDILISMLVMKVAIVLKEVLFFALLGLLRLLTGVLVSHWWQPPLMGEFH